MQIIYSNFLGTLKWPICEFRQFFCPVQIPNCYLNPNPCRVVQSGATKICEIYQSVIFCHFLEISVCFEGWGHFAVEHSCMS